MRTHHCYKCHTQFETLDMDDILCNNCKKEEGIVLGKGNGNSKNGLVCVLALLIWIIILYLVRN